MQINCANAEKVYLMPPRVAPGLVIWCAKMSRMQSEEVSSHRLPAGLEATYRSSFYSCINRMALDATLRAQVPRDGACVPPGRPASIAAPAAPYEKLTD